jgi:hypothetical protein
MEVKWRDRGGGRELGERRRIVQSPREQGRSALEPAPPSVKNVLVHVKPPLSFVVFIRSSFKYAVHGLLFWAGAGWVD